MPFINHIGFPDSELGKLMIPKNSKFQSSLNEIDIAMKSILLSQMRIADPRNKLKELKEDDPATNDWLWNESRVFQVDELETEEIFNTYLLRKNINNLKGVDVNYPLLAYHQEDLDTVFWGTGNRFKQWYFDIPVTDNQWEVGDSVYIVTRDNYFGREAQIVEFDGMQCKLSIDGTVITKTQQGLKKEPVWFDTQNLRPMGDKIPNKYKAKSITGKYTVAILVDNRDEAQYIRDKFILRCADANIWFRYYSPVINNTENQIYTVFGIPTLDRYPTSQDKINGKGYIYGVGFELNVWAMLTDTPLPQGFIEQIRMNLHVERDDRVNRIVITP